MGNMSRWNSNSPFAIVMIFHEISYILWKRIFLHIAYNRNRHMIGICMYITFIVCSPIRLELGMLPKRSYTQIAIASTHNLFSNAKYLHNYYSYWIQLVRYTRNISIYYILDNIPNLVVFLAKTDRESPAYVYTQNFLLVSTTKWTRFSISECIGGIFVHYTSGSCSIDIAQALFTCSKSETFTCQCGLHIVHVRIWILLSVGSIHE